MVKKKVKNERYYVYKYNGKVTCIAKLGDDGVYGWIGGKWVFVPGLRKIEWDITDYEDISQEEADGSFGLNNFEGN